MDEFKRDCWTCADRFIDEFRRLSTTVNDNWPVVLNHRDRNESRATRYRPAAEVVSVSAFRKSECKSQRCTFIIIFIQSAGQSAFLIGMKIQTWHFIKVGDARKISETARLSQRLDDRRFFAR